MKERSHLAAAVPSSRLMAAMSSPSSFQVYAMPEKIDNIDIAASGLGTAPFIISPRMTVSIGSENLITDKRR